MTRTNTHTISNSVFSPTTNFLAPPPLSPHTHTNKQVEQGAPYLYQAPPKLLGYPVPSAGPAGGGTVITVTGTSITTGQVRVCAFIGTIPAEYPSRRTDRPAGRQADKQTHASQGRSCRAVPSPPVPPAPFFSNTAACSHSPPSISLPLTRTPPPPPPSPPPPP